VILTYRYRLLPHKSQHRAVERWCESQRELYNAALEKRIDCYRKTGFTGYSLSVPHPTDGQLFVKLRDDPAAIHAVALRTQELSAEQEPAQPAARPAHAIGASAADSDPNPPPPSTPASTPASPAAPLAPPPQL
jgi:hypothetical protein